jgi:hypothetical protein
MTSKTEGKSLMTVSRTNSDTNKAMIKELIRIANTYEVETGKTFFHLNSIMGASRYVKDARTIQRQSRQAREFLI